MALGTHCTVHREETEAVCCARWGPPSKPRAQATLQ